MGWGFCQAASSVHPLDRSITDRTQLYGAFATLAAVGLVGGIVVVARWASPFVSLIPALSYLAWTVWFLISPTDAVDLVNRFPPAGELDDGLQVLLVSGVFALAGFVLLVPAWTLHRWKAAPKEEPEYEYT